MYAPKKSPGFSIVKATNQRFRSEEQVPILSQIHWFASKELAKVTISTRHNSLEHAYHTSLFPQSIPHK